MKGQGGGTLGRRRQKIAGHSWLGSYVKSKPACFSCAGIVQEFVETQRLGFRHTPRSHNLAPHAVLELLLALQHQDTGTMFGHCFCQG